LLLRALQSLQLLLIWVSCASSLHCSLKISIVPLDLLLLLPVLQLL
jgi:hypothetical protein